MSRQTNHKLLRLSFSQLIRRIIFAILVFILLGFFQVVIWVVPFRVYARRLNKNYIRAGNFNIRAASGYSRLIGRMVAKIARITPWPSKCLVQALTVKFLLRRFKIANEMFIGVAIDDKQKLSAHAWINVFDITVVGGTNSAEQFKVIKLFRDSYGNQE